MLSARERWRRRGLARRASPDGWTFDPATKEACWSTRSGDIATVTLNRPERLNALDKGMWRRLRDAMRLLGERRRPARVVLRGAGEKAFAAGADISEFATERADAAQAKAYGALIHEAMQAVARCAHPTVALIQGACIGGGLEIAAMCDLRICGASSRFGVPINRLGLTMGYGELQGLLALAGRAVTLEILLEGRVFDADEAYRKGLVSRVVADGEVERETYATADASRRARRWSRAGTSSSSSG